MLVVRNKISYIAFMKGMTVVELLVKAIQNSLNQFVEEGLIKLDKMVESKQNQIYDNIVSNKDG